MRTLIPHLRTLFIMLEDFLEKVFRVGEIPHVDFAGKRCRKYCTLENVFQYFILRFSQLVLGMRAVKFLLYSEYGLY